MKSKEKRKESDIPPASVLEEAISRSERKRRAGRVEDLARELVELPPRALANLPLTAEVRDAIDFARGLIRGARDRQVRTLAKVLRQEPQDVLLAELERLRGSQLRERDRHLRLERLRDTIINDAIAAREEKLPENEWQGGSIVDAGRLYPALDQHEARRLAWHFAATRAVRHGRELFRLLRAAEEEGERSARRVAQGQGMSITQDT